MRFLAFLSVAIRIKECTVFVVLFYPSCRNGCYVIDDPKVVPALESVRNEENSWCVIGQVPKNQNPLGNKYKLVDQVGSLLSFSRSPSSLAVCSMKFYLFLLVPRQITSKQQRGGHRLHSQFFLCSPLISDREMTGMISWTHWMTPKCSSVLFARL